MSMEKRWRLICYDIREPKRYRRVHKLVCGSGQPVQYSVFRARLDDRELERLRWRLSKVLAPEDSLIVIDLCPRCAGRVVAKNAVEGWTVDEPSFLIVPAAQDHDHEVGDEVLPRDDEEVGDSQGDSAL